MGGHLPRQLEFREEAPLLLSRPSADRDGPRRPNTPHTTVSKPQKLINQIFLNNQICERCCCCWRPRFLSLDLKDFFYYESFSQHKTISLVKTLNIKNFIFNIRCSYLYCSRAVYAKTFSLLELQINVRASVWLLFLNLFVDVCYENSADGCLKNVYGRS